MLPRDLYLLPFDHRGSFERDLFGYAPPLSGQQRQHIQQAKTLVYQGFLQANVPGPVGGILVDEQFGASILQDAKARGFTTACPLEKSGQVEFELEFGAEFGTHLAALNPTYAKVLVRYNPRGDTALNARQRQTLGQLCEYLQSCARPLMFELLVPPLHGQSVCESEAERPALMVQAIHELQGAGVEAALWKVEGVSSQAQAQALVAAARRGGRDSALIVLGRGANEARVERWLRLAASVSGFVGFAVGRSTFEAPLKAYLSGQLSAEAAMAHIAQKYQHWAEVFSAARATTEA